MQLSNIKKTFARQQQADEQIDGGGGLETTQARTEANAPGIDNQTSIMSLTNIVISTSKPDLGINHLKFPVRAHSSTNIGEKLRRSKDKRLRFNVCGEKFEILESTVQRFPNTLLADSSRLAKLWDEELREYYLDRNRACFESVLTYYQSNGLLIRPQNIPDVLFIRELQFYDLGEEVLQKVRGMYIVFVLFVIYQHGSVNRAYFIQIHLKYDVKYRYSILQHINYCAWFMKLIPHHECVAKV
jgi:hypothetical protein